MFTQLKVKTIDLLTNPHARTALILGTVMIAALVGGAPSDFGGGGGP